MLAHIWFALSTVIVQMFAVRILTEIAAGNTGMIQAMIADRVKPTERARCMKLFGAAMGTDFVAGPAFGGLFSGFGEGRLYQATFLLAAGFGAIALLSSLWLNERGTIATASIAAKTLLLKGCKDCFPERTCPLHDGILLSKSLFCKG